MPCGVPQVGRVDHDRFRYGFRCREPLHHAQEDTLLAPPLPAIVERLVRPIVLRRITSA